MCKLRRFTIEQTHRRRPQARSAFALHRTERNCGAASTELSGKQGETGTSGYLPEVVPPFAGAEVRNTLKEFHPRKAPGIDGFTADIYQAAIFRDLGMFLAMANKCLELGYFARAWKIAVIKVTLQLEMDEYIRLKFYRPIGNLDDGCSTGIRNDGVKIYDKSDARGVNADLVCVVRLKHEAGARRLLDQEMWLRARSRRILNVDMIPSEHYLRAQAGRGEALGVHRVVDRYDAR
ncbi:hypothetical protein EVAR_497_1 [Eumeta japonica]|uniref:115 kDa protein in type-1 retrotransposable element R1DM n=1 Tax=Eumeta variegata TaxID=151549 RepID=A0A4C1SAI1_EUMVA|nr:hypothetical protein EVAR_497_1 [Eumeta japonica]